MIEIIKHGHKPIEVACKRCECIFRFDKRDLKTEYLQGRPYEGIDCPECRIHMRWPFGEKSGLKYNYGDAPPI